MGDMHPTYWDCLLIVFEDEIKTREDIAAGTKTDTSLSAVETAVENEVKEMLEGQNMGELDETEREIKESLNSGDEDVDVEFFQAVLAKIPLYKAKRQVSFVHNEAIRRAKEAGVRINWEEGTRIAPSTYTDKPAVDPKDLWGGGFASNKTLAKIKADTNEAIKAKKSGPTAASSLLENEGIKVITEKDEKQSKKEEKMRKKLAAKAGRELNSNIQNNILESVENNQEEGEESDDEDDENKSPEDDDEEAEEDGNLSPRLMPLGALTSRMETAEELMDNTRAPKLIKLYEGPDYILINSTEEDEEQRRKARQRT